MPNLQFTKPWHGIPREEIVWNPSVIEEACIGCGTCVTGCSRLVYRYDYERQKAVVADPLNCMVGCTTCANTCPTHAIRFPDISTIFALEGHPEVHHTIEDDLNARHDQLAWHDVVPHPEKIVTLRVDAISYQGDNTMILTLSPLTSADSLSEFMPGQYLHLLPPQSGWLARAYSIANAPRTDGSIELQIRRAKDGRMSKWLFEDLHVGDTLKARGPMGSFTLRSKANTPLVFIAGGTGFAPIKAMIEQQLTHQPQSLIKLFWGVSVREDLYELDLLEKWTKINQNMQITLAISHGPLPDNLPKRMKAHAVNIIKEINETDSDFTGVDVYAAGSPSMIPAVIDTLTSRGVALEHIHVDSFGQ